MDNQSIDLLREWLGERRGRQVALAAHVNVRPSVVAAWVSCRRPVPVEHAAQIEEFTSGKVSRVALFPDVWRRIWPELAVSEQKHAQALTQQAQVAINSEAMEATHG